MIGRSSRFWLAAVFAFVVANPAAAAKLPRSTTDRPDEVQGDQVHFLYVLPSDGADRALDTNGALATSIAVFQKWFAGQTGGLRFRIDSFQGEPDITFYRLPKTDAEIESRGAFVRDEIEAELNAAGFHQSGKMYAVYYDGSSTFACGGSFYPPTLPGNTVAMYLQGKPPGAPPCVSNPFASSPNASPGYWEFSMTHEILHGLGIVPACAPHHTLAGHVSDCSCDLMYAGTEPWHPSVLDFHHDDYFRAGVSGCPDLANSSFLIKDSEPKPK